MDQEERKHLERMLGTYVRSLRQLEEQSAFFGPLYTPMYIENGIFEIKERIAEVRSKLGIIENTDIDNSAKTSTKLYIILSIIIATLIVLTSFRWGEFEGQKGGLINIILLFKMYTIISLTLLAILIIIGKIRKKRIGNGKIRTVIEYFLSISGILFVMTPGITSFAIHDLSVAYRLVALLLPYFGALMVGAFGKRG